MASNARLWDFFMIKKAKWQLLPQLSYVTSYEWLGKNGESTWVYNSNTHDSLRKWVMKRFVSFVMVLTFFFNHWWWQIWTWTIFSPMCTSSKMTWRKFGYKPFFFFLRSLVTNLIINNGYNSIQYLFIKCKFWQINH